MTSLYHGKWELSNIGSYSKDDGRVFFISGFNETLNLGAIAF